MKIKLLLVDDHAVVRMGLKSLLEDEPRIEIIGQASSGIEAITFVNNNTVDVILLDINMPDLNGIETAKLLLKAGSKAKILIFSMHNDPEYVLKSVEAGVHGYLLKDASKEDILKGIETVFSNNKYFPSTISEILVSAIQTGGQLNKPKVLNKLSKKEIQILKLIALGKNSQEIASELDLSIRTVSNHRANMLKKTNLNNTVELVRLASIEGL